MATIKFNDYDFGKNFVIANVARPLPEFRISSTRIDGADGEMLDDVSVGVRECSFDIVAKAKSREDLHKLARKLAGVLLVREAKKLVFTDEKAPKKDGMQLFRLAIPSGVFDMEEFIKAARWTCRFKQIDPYLLSAKPRTEVIDKRNSSGNYAAKIDVGGNAPANLAVTATPANGKTYYSIAAKGRSHVRYMAPFDGQHGIRLDFKNQTAKLYKTDESAQALNAAGLTSGSRFFEFSGRLTIVANAPTTLKWYERWL